MNANIKNATRREVYRRDGYRCALCDSSQGLQVHHAIARGEGGTDSPQNLITLCSYCHSHAHGRPLYELEKAEVEIAKLKKHTSWKGGTAEQIGSVPNSV